MSKDPNLGKRGKETYLTARYAANARSLIGSPGLPFLLTT